MEPWEKYVELKHLSGKTKDQLERRRRQRQVRYLLYSLQNSEAKGEALVDPKPENVPGLQVALPGFVDFWLKEKPQYAVRPSSDGGKIRIRVYEKLKDKTVLELGGYSQFAKRWDVDEDLKVYLRWSSVWQEWNATLARVVPILGDV